MKKYEILFFVKNEITWGGVCFFFLLCSVESMQQSLEMKSKDSHGVLFLEGTQVITNKKGFVMGSNASLGVNKAKSGGSF